jgi:hypothetical protein
MDTPKIIPASYPDTVADVAEGATFYLDAGRGHVWEGQAFIMTAEQNMLGVRVNDENVPTGSRSVVRLSDGRPFHFELSRQVRVIALGAHTIDDRW